MTDFDRRSFLAGSIASLGLAATSSKDLFAALALQDGGANPRRIDIHHHFGPPTWVKEVKGNKLLQPPNATWTPQQSIDDMDRGGCQAAVVSITNPGLFMGDQAVTTRLARECNDFAAKMIQDHPTRFGLFAAMPMPDVDATLKEIEYAYDTLHTDGVGLLTSFGDIWLGNPKFRPVMAELNRRKAVVHVHPTAANCCRNIDYAPVHPAAMEYGADTTRAIMGIVYYGDAERYPDIKYIWSHAGGTVPFMAGRVSGQARRLSPEARQQAVPNGFIPEIKKFYYDTAGAINVGALSSLMTLVSSDRVLFGTDFPPGGKSLEVDKALRALNMFSEADLRLIERENAVKLLPRLNVKA